MNSIAPIVARAQTDAGTGSTGTLPSSQGLNDMFLQLLVAQLQNQNPLDPMDPSQFVGQLAQFSELSEVTQIRELLQDNSPAAANTSASSSSQRATSASLGSVGSTQYPSVTPSSHFDLQGASAAMPTPTRSLIEHAISGAF